MHAYSVNAIFFALNYFAIIFCNPLDEIGNSALNLPLVVFVNHPDIIGLEQTVSPCR